MSTLRPSGESEPPRGCKSRRRCPSGGSLGGLISSPTRGLGAYSSSRLTSPMVHSPRLSRSATRCWRAMSRAATDLRMLLEQASQVDCADARMLGRVRILPHLLRVGRIVEQHREAGVPRSKRLVIADREHRRPAAPDHHRALRKTSCPTAPGRRGIRQRRERGRASGRGNRPKPTPS